MLLTADDPPLAERAAFGGSLPATRGPDLRKQPCVQAARRGAAGEPPFPVSLPRPQGGWERRGEPAVAWLELFHERSTGLSNRA